MLMLTVLACVGTDGSVPSSEATQGEFEVRLSVHGELDAKNSERIVTPDFNSRPEIGWIIDEGTQVKKGDKLVVFDTAEMEKQLETAETGLRLARTKIAQESAKLQLKLADARGEIQKAEMDLELARMRRTDSDTVPLVEREQAKVSETKAAMAIDAAKANLETVELESRAETQLQQLDVDRNAREVEELREQLQNAELKAPTDGIALLHTKTWDNTKWKVGNRPWSGAKLLKLPDLNTMEVVAWVHEVDTPQIAKGQAAIVTMDAHPDAPVTGTIEKVADLAVARGEDEVKYLEVKVALDASTPEMKPGMTVRVDLLLASHPDKIFVPIESVFKEEAQAFVYTTSLGGWSSQTVELGPENDTHVVVESGLEAGTLVALVNPTTWGEDAKRPVASDATP